MQEWFYEKGFINGGDLYYEPKNTMGGAEKKYFLGFFVEGAQKGYSIRFVVFFSIMFDISQSPS